MRKVILFLGTFVFPVCIHAQVGIGNSTPASTLDITGKASVISAADGVIAPRLTKQQLAAKSTGVYTALQTGSIVYINDTAAPAGTIPSAAQVVEITNTGYYYFDGSIWKKMGNNADTSIYANDGTLSENRIVTQGASTLAFNATNVNAFSVDGSTLSINALNDRVGIGTIAPQRPLHVNANTSSVRFENLATVPSNISSSGLVIDANGDIYKNNTVSVEGQILRIGLNGVTYLTSGEAGLRFGSVDSAAEMGNAPNGAPNFINTIVGAAITDNIAVGSGQGAPSRTTDQITLQPGVYKLQVRLVGNFSSLSTNNTIFLKSIVNNNEYSLVNISNYTSQTSVYYFDDYINITGNAQTVDFTVSPTGSTFTTSSNASPGSGNSFRSLILIQRLR